MYNYFMLIGTLEEDFIKITSKKSIIKLKCWQHPYNNQVLPVNVTRIETFMDDFNYKGDTIAIKGSIEIDNKGNIELLAERLMFFKKNEE